MPRDNAKRETPAYILDAIAIAGEFNARAGLKHAGWDAAQLKKAMPILAARLAQAGDDVTPSILLDHALAGPDHVAAIVADLTTAARPEPVTYESAIHAIRMRDPLEVAIRQVTPATMVETLRAHKAKPDDYARVFTSAIERGDHDLIDVMVGDEFVSVMSGRQAYYGGDYQGFLANMMPVAARQDDLYALEKILNEGFSQMERNARVASPFGIYRHHGNPFDEIPAQYGYMHDNRDGYTEKQREFLRRFPVLTAQNHILMSAYYNDYRASWRKGGDNPVPARAREIMSARQSDLWEKMEAIYIDPAHPRFGPSRSMLHNLYGHYYQIPSAHACSGEKEAWARLVMGAVHPPQPYREGGYYMHGDGMESLRGLSDALKGGRIDLLEILDTHPGGVRALFDVAYRESRSGAGRYDRYWGFNVDYRVVSFLHKAGVDVKSCHGAIFRGIAMDEGTGNRIGEATDCALRYIDEFHGGIAPENSDLGNIMWAQLSSGDMDGFDALRRRGGVLAMDENASYRVHEFLRIAPLRSWDRLFSMMKTGDGVSFGTDVFDRAIVYSAYDFSRNPDCVAILSLMAGMPELDVGRALPDKIVADVFEKISGSVLSGGAEQDTIMRPAVLVRDLIDHNLVGRAVVLAHAKDLLAKSMRSEARANYCMPRISNILATMLNAPVEDIIDPALKSDPGASRNLAVMNEMLERQKLWTRRMRAVPPSALLPHAPFHGFKPDTFHDLCGRIAKEMDRTPYSESVVDYALIAMRLFGGADRVYRYLERWGTAGKQPLHNVIQKIKLPPKETKFDAQAWGDAALRFGPEMARMVAWANILPRPLSSLSATRAEVSKHAYPRSGECRALSGICFSHAVSENIFNKALDFYLEQKAAGFPAAVNIPDVTIPGEKFDMPGYRFRRLAPDDPRGLFLGEYTDCCQSIGGNADRCARNGFSSPNGGFYVIESDAGEIVGQSWAWRGKDRELVFDSLETLGKRVSAGQWNKVLDRLAAHLKRSNPCRVSAFNVGRGGETPKDLPYEKLDDGVRPLDDISYGDSRTQFRVWAKPGRRKKPDATLHASL